MLKINKIIILTAILFLVNSRPGWAQEPATKASVTKVTGQHTQIVQGELKAVDAKILTVSQNGTDYKVTVSNSTKLRRRFWGKADLSEFSQNDNVSVYGKWANEDKTAINATLVRDLSIQKRTGTFFGIIESIDQMTLTINTAKRGEVKVTLADSTKIVNRKMQAMKLADLKTGEIVRLKGLWDQVNSTITAVTQLKDFSQPVAASASPEVSPKASAKASASESPKASALPTASP